MDLAGFHPGMKASGGKEVGHADSVRIKLMSSKSDDNTIKDKINIGDNLMEVQTGRKVKWTIDKNKQNGRYGEDYYNLFFRGDRVGIDKAGELLAYGVKTGIIDTRGTYYYIGEDKLGQGAKNAATYLRDNPEIAEKLEVDILAQPI
jgi:hypothetical protein